MQHGRDSLATLFGAYFDDAESAELPSEELFRLRDGADFGWPYCYYDHFLGRRVLAPEYGGDGEAEGDCGRYERPLVAFPGHWAPHDMMFYTGGQFSDRYREGAFVVFHGSWNRAPMEQQGYQVAFAPRRDGEFTGEWETFAEGFAAVSPLVTPRDAVHRPAGIAQGAGRFGLRDRRRRRPGLADRLSGLLDLAARRKTAGTFPVRRHREDHEYASTPG